MSQPLDKIGADQYVKVDIAKYLAEGGVASLPPELLKSMQLVETAQLVTAELEAGRQPLASELSLKHEIDRHKGRTADMLRNVPAPTLTPDPQRDGPDR